MIDNILIFLIMVDGDIYEDGYGTTEEDKELLEKIRQMQKDDELRKLKFEEKNRVFKERQAFAKNFIDNLTDLNKFKQDGWYFSYSGIEDEKGRISWF